MNHAIVTNNHILQHQQDEQQDNNGLSADSSATTTVYVVQDTSNNDVPHCEITNNNNTNINMDKDDSIYTRDSNYGDDVPFFYRLKGLIFDEFIKAFSPVYFVSIMGTGISSSLLYHFPYPAEWLEICSYIMFGITCICFIVTTTLFILQCWYFPGRFKAYHVDTAQAVFMGCYSMGYITIVNFIENITDGRHTIFVWVLWWIAVFSAIYTAFLIVYLSFMSKLNEVDLDAKLNATLLLPIVAITVVSSSGHQLELKLPTTNQMVVTMIVSFMLWCLSISLAFMIMTIYLHRLIVHKIPPTNLIFTSFLPVGFLGQSSYSVMLFGVNLHQLIPEELMWGKILLCICGFFSVFLLSFGYFQTFVAIMSIFSKIKPFAKSPNPTHTNKYGLLKIHKGFWAMTFPLGTMSLSNTELGKGVIGDYPLLTFKVMGAIFAAACILITCACTIGAVVHTTKRIASLFQHRSDIDSDDTCKV